MKILLGGGGTGGHLIPGVALYKAFQNYNVDLLYVMSERDKAYDVSTILKEDERIVVSLQGISRKFSWTTGKQIMSIIKAWYQAYQKIKVFNPDICVITGGYLSNIVALSAFIMRKPLYMLEQNSVAGITNRVWAFATKKIFTALPQPKFIPKDKIIMTGNPLLYTTTPTKENARDIMGFKDSFKPLIGILGGSQGAQKINDLIYDLIPQLLQKGYQILWSLGTKEYERFKKENKLLSLEAYQDDLQVYRFITRMDAFWSASSLVIARAGAGTVAESLFFQKPCIFVPIYRSPDNHQYLNALYLTEKKCALIIEEPDLTEEKLLYTLEKMLAGLPQYVGNFPSHSQDDSAQIIVQNILKKSL